MVVELYDQFFVKRRSLGKKSSAISMLGKKLKEGYFYWDEQNRDNLIDSCFYDGKLYAIDKQIGRVNIFNYSSFEKSFDGEFSNYGLSGVYVDESGIYLVDKNEYKVIKYDHEFKMIKEYSFIDKSLMPLKIYKNLVICKELSGAYNENYTIVNVKEISDDRDKKPFKEPVE